MATRLSFENVGLHTIVTDPYCLFSHDSKEDYRTIKATFAGHTRIIKTTIAGSKDIGRLCVGNNHGLILPHDTTDEEYEHLCKHLPIHISIQRLKTPVADLGYRVACDDYFAFVDPDLDEEIVDVIIEILNVRVQRRRIAQSNLVGSCCVMSRKGCLVPSTTTFSEIDEIHEFLRVPVEAGTVNYGSLDIANKLAVNSGTAFCGSKTTDNELALVESTFDPVHLKPWKPPTQLRRIDPKTGKAIPLKPSKPSKLLFCG